MNYDENVFKEKANIKARRIWLVFALLLTANYGSDAANGLYPFSNYIIFVVLCWVPFFIGDILLRLKGKSTDLYKYDLVIGYGIFYTFVSCTTASPIAFTNSIGTALPICNAESDNELLKTKSSGNVCNRAASRIDIALSWL